MNAWDATTYEGKATILRVVREEAARLISLAGRPGAWEAPTACERWAVRDVVGHLVDTTEGYFGAFEAARAGAEAARTGWPGCTSGPASRRHASAAFPSRNCWPGWAMISTS